LKSEATTPRFGFITPNLCSDGHDGTCAGPNSTGGNTGGLTGADQFLHAWVPLILSSPAYRHGDMLVVITFDEAEGTEADAACCNEQPGPNSSTTGGGAVGALLLNPKYIVAGSTDTTGSYNHYSALRSYEDLLGLTSGGTDGEGHLGYAAARGLQPFGTDVFQVHAHGSGRDGTDKKS
jgi:phosphatidylinositol-3-phosphatase